MSAFTSDEQAIQALPKLLAAPQTTFRTEGHVSVAPRKDRLQRVIDMLVKHCDPFCAAMEADFGDRSPGFSMMNDVAGSLGSLKHARDHLETWAQDQSRPSVAPFDNFGATAWVKYQPKGVVGIIGTWNAPLFTLLSPLSSVFAAGNPASLKAIRNCPTHRRTTATNGGRMFQTRRIDRGPRWPCGSRRIFQTSLEPLGLHRRHQCRQTHHESSLRQPGASHFRAGR